MAALTQITAIFLVCMALLQARDPIAVSQGTVSGIVWCPEDQLPARRAIVSVSSTALPIPRAAITDDEGRFAIQGLPAGRFSVTVLKPAYVWPKPTHDATYQLELQDDERLEGLVLVLHRGAAISGFVRDIFGVTVAGARVASLRAVSENVFQPTSTMAVSDDRGYFRLFGLTPGEYIVYASHRHSPLTTEISIPSVAQIDALLGSAGQGVREFGQSPVFGVDQGGTQASLAPIYHPGVTSLSHAARVRLNYGDDRTGTDITMVRAYNATIEGAVAPLPPNSEVSVVLAQDGPVATNSGHRTHRSRDAKFVFRGVPPGSYTLHARVLDGTATSLWARSSIQLEGTSVSGILLALEPPLRLEGRVVLADGSALPPQLRRSLRIDLVNAAEHSLRPALTTGLTTGAVVTASLASDGSFAVRGLTRGKHAFRIRGLPAEIIVASATIDGTEMWGGILDLNLNGQPYSLTVSLSARGAGVFGVVDLNGMDQRGGPVEVVVFPVESHLRAKDSARILVANVDRRGRYNVSRLAPGEYYVAAAQGLGAHSELTAKLLEELAPVATKVRLSLGSNKEANLGNLAIR